MSQIGPYLSQMGPKNHKDAPPDWRWPSSPQASRHSERDPYMSRSKTYGLVLALMASAALSTACTKTDATGPSEQPQVSFEEGQGSNNGK
jgi:hypothetical protein